MIDIPDNWMPTPENVNKLPRPVFEYVHGLESLCDPAHIIMENTLLRDQTKMLDAKLAKLKKELRISRRLTDIELINRDLERSGKMFRDAMPTVRQTAANLQKAIINMSKQGKLMRTLKGTKND